MKKICLTFLMLIATVPLWAVDFVEGGIAYKFYGNEVYVTYHASDQYGDDYYAGSVVIPSTVTRNEVTYNVTGIDPAAFAGCSKTIEVTIPESVVAIGEHAFRECTSLKKVNLPLLITELKTGTFYGCKSLESIIIGANVASIGSGCFSECESLASIVCNAATPPVATGAFDSYTATLTVPYGKKELYSADAVWGLFNNTEEGSPILNYKVTSNTTVEVISGDYGGNVVIPSEVVIKGKVYSVTSIGDKSFYNCIELTSVTISEGVRRIGSSAFEGCTGLTSVTIPNSVTSISGSYAFLGCSGLTSIVVETGNTVYDSRDNCNAIIQTATNELIQGCKSTVIPNSVTSIGRTAFYCCEGLTSVTIPNSVTSIGSSAFQRCANLTNVAIPEGVTSISDRVFSGCTSLTYIELPSTITTIGELAFSGRSGHFITRTMKCYAKTPPTLGDDVFSYNNLTLEVPFESVSDYKAIKGWVKNITSANYNIGSITYKGKDVDGIYYLATSKTEVEVISNPSKYTGDVVIPAEIIVDDKKYSVTRIGDNAFKDCNSLTSVTIPEGVTSIGDYAFNNCSSLFIVDCNAVTPPTISSNSLPSSSLLLLVPIGSRDAYKADEVWGTISNIVEKGSCDVEVTNSNAGDLGRSILVQTRKDLNLITKLIVHGTLNVEDISLISTSMTSLLELDISDTDLTEIPEDAFFKANNNSSLVSIKLPKVLKTICKQAFRNCLFVKNITLPETLEVIEEYAFQDCKSLCDIELPASVKSIGRWAFAASGVQYFDMSKAINLTDVNQLFYGCGNLRTIKFSNSIKKIDSFSFNYCVTLDNVVLPEKLEVIGDYAFNACTNLKSIDFTKCSLLTTIGGGAFKNCSNLSSVDFSKCKSLLSIGNEAFSKCNNITVLDFFATSLETINNNAFSDCSAIKTINFPSTLKTIGTNAFNNCTNISEMSVPCAIPPTIEGAANPFNGVDNIACILSIPTESFVDYYVANYWGGFVSVQKKGEIKVEVSRPIVGDDVEDKRGCHIHYKKHNSRSTGSLLSIKSIKTLEEVSEILEFADAVTSEGQSLFMKFDDSITLYFTPEEGKEIESVYFNDEDVTSQLVNNALTVSVTSDMTMTKLIVNLKNVSSVLLGDVNGDSEVDVSDVMALANFILGKDVNDFNNSVADVNKDGTIDVSDVMALANKILGK